MAFYGNSPYAPRFAGLSSLDDPIDYSLQRLHGERMAAAAAAAAAAVAPPPSRDPLHGTADRLNTMLERENATLRQELKASREKTAELLKELTSAREESRSLSLRGEELQREVQHARETAAHTNSLKVAEAQAELALLRQEARTRDTQLSAMQEQLRGEVERMRSQAEHLEAQRRECDDLRTKLQAAHDKVEAGSSQASRRDELVKLLETDIGHKQQRLEQSERLVLSLQNQVTEKDLAVQKWQAEAEARGRMAADWEAQARKYDALRVDMEQRLEKTRASYAELCDVIGAADVQRSAYGGASGRLREILALESKLRQEVQEAQQMAELRQYELNNKNMALEQHKAEAARLQEALRSKDAEMNSLREELLTRTRDLRSITSNQSSFERDERTRADQLSRMQALVEQRDHQSQDRERAFQAQSQRDQAALLEARNDSLRMQTEHARTVAGLQQRIGELEQQSRVENDYVEACRRMGRMLCVDPTTTPSAYANDIVVAVERVLRDLEQLRLRGAPAAGAAAAVGYAFHPHPPAHPQPPSYGMYMVGGGDALNRSTAAGLPKAPGGAVDADWLKAQLMESEQRFVKAQVRHDSLLRDLARELRMADMRDADLLLAEVAKLAKSRSSTSAGRAPVPPSTPPTAHKRPGTAATLRLGPAGGERTATELQRQLAAAMSTIESQDKWIALLNARIEGAGTALPSSQLRELQVLRDEAQALKQQLADRATVSERAMAADFEARLQRHIDFRSALLKTLQMPAVSATDEAILRRVEQLMYEATKPAIPSQLTSSLNAGPSTLARLPTPYYGLGAGHF